MEHQALVCPVCGAPHKKTVPSGVAQVKCSYCGASILVPTNAPRCPNHPDLLATAVCNDCGNDYCRNCLTPFEVGGDGERGVLQLCSNCLSSRRLGRAEKTMMLGVLMTFFSLFSMLFNLSLGILFLAVFAVPIIVYGVHLVRSSHTTNAIPSGRYTALESPKHEQATQEIYQYALNEFVRSFGMVHGSIMFENRIKAYMKDGLSREEAIRQLAKDIDY